MGYLWYSADRQSIENFPGAFIRRDGALSRLFSDGPENLYFPNDHVVLCVSIPMMLGGLIGVTICLGKGVSNMRAHLYSHLRPVMQAVTLGGAAGTMIFDVPLIRSLNELEQAVEHEKILTKHRRWAQYESDNNMKVTSREISGIAEVVQKHLEESNEIKVSKSAEK